VGGVAVENHEFIERIAVYDEPAAATGDIEPVAREIQVVVSGQGKIDVHVYCDVGNDARGVATAGQGQAGERKDKEQSAHGSGGGGAQPEGVLRATGLEILEVERFKVRDILHLTGGELLNGFR